MVSIQRRFNSTGRMRIPRSHIEVALQEPLDPGGFPVAFATFNFDGLNLPPSANMVLEAYFRSSSMRFPCGTVESLAVPSSMELSEIDRPERVWEDEPLKQRLLAQFRCQSGNGTVE